MPRLLLSVILSGLALRCLTPAPSPATTIATAPATTPAVVGAAPPDLAVEPARSRPAAVPADASPTREAVEAVAQAATETPAMPEATLIVAPAAAVTSLPTPTAVALDTLTHPEDTTALAGVAGDPSAEGATVPTPAAVPPSARLIVVLTPTPNVLASSPVLAGAGVSAGTVDAPGAVKMVQDSRKGQAGQRLVERIEEAVARAKQSGTDIEIVGWEAMIKGSVDVYQVTYMLRLNRQGMRAEWEANLATGEVRAINALAQALEAP